MSRYDIISSMKNYFFMLFIACAVLSTMGACHASRSQLKSESTALCSRSSNSLAQADIASAMLSHVVTFEAFSADSITLSSGATVHKPVFRSASRAKSKSESSESVLVESAKADSSITCHSSYDLSEPAEKKSNALFIICCFAIASIAAMAISIGKNK